MLEKRLLVIFAIVIFVCYGQEVRQRLPDVGLNVKQLIEKYGYPFENHTVQTEDGYLLDIYRIPSGRNNVHIKNTSVFLMPGLLCSSAVWVNMGLEKSLGFVLADEGYDVWLANYRGTTWSRKHVLLNPDKDRKQYWDFSFHEIGIYDMKAFIDHILATTNQEDLLYLGHSQGTTSLFVLLSERPEYNRKIRMATLLAPVVYMEHAKSLLYPLFTIYKPQIEKFAELFHFYEILPHHPLITFMAQTFCNDDSPVQSACSLVFYITSGFSPRQLNKTMIPVIASTTPSGSSIWQYQHYAQFMNSKQFHQYDYGKTENMIKYGQPTPPLYNLSRTTIPVSLYHGSRDALSSKKDANRLAAELPNVIKKRQIRGFNHLDYMWGIDAPKVLFGEILENMQRYAVNTKEIE